MSEDKIMDLVVLEGQVFDIIGINDAKIAQAKEKFMPLTIKDMDDKAGLKAVHEGRMIVRDMRILVEKHAKKVREKAVKFQKDVIAEEKRVVGLIQPIEDHLSDEENRVEEEKARIKAAEEARALAILQARENRLLDMGCRFDRITNSYSYGALVAPVAMIKVAPDAQWETIVSAIQEAVDADRIAKEAEDARIIAITAEQNRIAFEQAKERERLASEAKILQDAQDAMAREKKAAEDAILKAEQDKQRAIELENAKTAAAENARIETEARIKREAEEKIAREKAEAEAKIAKELKAKEAAERKAARLPDKVKLQNYLVTLFGIPAPELKTPEGTEAWREIDAALEELNVKFGQIVEAL